MLTSTEIKWKFKDTFNGAANFMTPIIVRYGSKDDSHILYELSKGQALMDRSKMMYGVTVLRKENDSYIHDHALSEGGFTQKEAYEHISALKGLEDE